MSNLSEKQKRILDFVNNEVREKGYPPSVREICKAVGFKSTSSVHRHLEKLQELGLLEKGPSKPRALKLKTSGSPENPPLAKELVNVPLIGKIAAGQPILAEENIMDTFPLPVEYTGNSTVFMLEVKGESMINAGILDGDLVLVRKQSTAENGDIVAALIGDEATIKTFYKEEDHIRLQPENDFMEPIIVKDDILIMGKVIGLFRKF